MSNLKQHEGEVTGELYWGSVVPILTATEMEQQGVIPARLPGNTAPEVLVDKQVPVDGQCSIDKLYKQR